MRPAQFSPQCGENVGIWKSLRNAETMSQLLLAPSFAKILSQLRRQSRHDLLAVIGSFAFENHLIQTHADISKAN